MAASSSSAAVPLKSQMFLPISRTGSTDSTETCSSTNSELIGRISSATPLFTENFTEAPANTSTAHLTISASPATPPFSRTPSPDAFDDKRLPAELSTTSASSYDSSLRHRSTQHASASLDAASSDGIPVKLEKLPGASRGYVLRIDDELRMLLASQIAERALATRSDGTRRARRFGDLVFTQQLSTFDRANPNTAKSPFHGFFVLIWLGVFILMLKTAAENYRAKGRVVDVDILQIMFEKRQLIDCLLSDSIMFFGCTLWCVPLQQVVAKGWIGWHRIGWALQAVWQAVYLGGVIGYILYKDWPWIQSVFIVLHCLVILMKQHSYAFYNGHLSEVYARHAVLAAKLSQLKDAGVEIPVSTSATGASTDSHDELRQRRRSVGLVDIGNLPDGESLSPTQLEHFVALLTTELDACDAELSYAAPMAPRVTYPANLTYFNFLEYLHFPTVVYELTYPRSATINWSYVAEKATATFGVLGIMIVVSQHWIYPVVLDCNALLHLPMSARLAEFPWILLRLIFPFMAEYILVWYLIWELILNLLGEATRFADRGFYGAWWNATTWDAFARDWNKPVHAFLLRHVYHSSISTWRISRQTATLVTFLLSAIVHELVMWCIFKKLRGYLLLAQMAQLPLVALSRTRLLKGRETLGNVLFWIGIWTGPSFLSASYLIL